MSVWEYRDSVSDRDLIREGLEREECIYCGDRLLVNSSGARKLDCHERDRILRGREYLEGATGATTRAICPVCGWWWSKIWYENCYSGTSDPVDPRWFNYLGYERLLRGTVGRLRNLDVSDISVPINEVRSYLAAQPEARFGVHPRKFEEVVASVFQDQGYLVELTAYSADGGIDMVLEGSGTRSVGVQVKRYRDAICVEQIRSFSGALFLKGYTKGVFVTTSRYESGCKNVSALARLRGIPIELYDGVRFLEALRVAQRKANSNILIPRDTLEDLPLIVHESKSLPKW